MSTVLFCFVFFTLKRLKLHLGVFKVHANDIFALQADDHIAKLLICERN